MTSAHLRAAASCKRSLLLAAALFLTTAVCQAQVASSPRERLNQYVADLQRNPSDDALREKIIELALTLDPKPAVPDAAVVAAAKGKVVFAHAAESASKEDLQAAADAFGSALAAAPWVADYYFNQSLALEKLGHWNDAIRVLHLYLLAAPRAPDAIDVRGRIEGLKFEQAKAEKVCNEVRDAEHSIRWLDGDHDVTLRLSLIETHSDGPTRPHWYSSLLDFEDMTTDLPPILGHHGWEVWCTHTDDDSCPGVSAFVVGGLYPGRVNGEALVSVTRGASVIRPNDRDRPASSAFFFPSETNKALAACR